MLAGTGDGGPMSSLKSRAKRGENLSKKLPASAFVTQARMWGQGSLDKGIEAEGAAEDEEDEDNGGGDGDDDEDGDDADEDGDDAEDAEDGDDDEDEDHDHDDDDHDISITGIHLLGERHSGTNMLHSTLESVAKVPVDDGLCSYKHWFQRSDCAPALDRSRLTIIVVRNAADWVQGFYAQPWNAPCHQGLDFKTFLHRPWSITSPTGCHPTEGRPEQDYVSRTSDRAFLLAQPDEYYNHDKNPLQLCTDSTKKLKPGHMSLELPGEYCGRVPMYERDPITGKAIGGVVQLRNAKVAHWLRLAEEARSPVLIVRYEHLAGFEEPDFATATQPLMKWLSKLRRRWPKLLVDAHTVEDVAKRQIGDEGSWTARQGKSNSAIRQPVLTGGAGPPCIQLAPDSPWGNATNARFLKQTLDWDQESKLGYSFPAFPVCGCPDCGAGVKGRSAGMGARNGKGRGKRKGAP